MNKDIRGVAIYRNGPWFSHLFFADDSELFCRAMEAECHRILEILAVYELGSEKKINREKTNIFFSSNTQAHVKARTQALLGVPTIRQYENIFGLACSFWSDQETKLYLHQGKSMEETTRLEGKAPLTSRKGSYYKGSNPGHPYLYYELLEAPQESNKRVGSFD